MNNGRDERIEQLLRKQHGVALSPDFRRDVLAAVAKLPDPGLLPGFVAAASSSRTAAGMPPPQLIFALAAGVLVMALGALLLVAPHFSATLAAWQWELADTTLALNIGGAALSASLLSLLCAGLGGALLTLLGMYGRRNHLLGA
jgi:hypothetical protein